MVILTLQAVVLAVVMMQMEVPGDILVNLPCFWHIPPWFHYIAGPLACQLSGLIITGQHNGLLVSQHEDLKENGYNPALGSGDPNVPHLHWNKGFNVSQLLP